MRSPTVLNEVQIEEIRKLAREKRRLLDVNCEMPLANDIFLILEQLDIKLLEYPVYSDSDRPAFSAAIMCDEVNGKEIVFIGLNTADYFDKQIFAIAHELYHYFTKTGWHLSRLNDIEKTIVEAKANRFAAEFLLPESIFKNIILEEFNYSTLVKITDKAMLRFIARIQCTWWLPFRAIVSRLDEIGAISKEQYDNLYTTDERSNDGEYYRLGTAFDIEAFKRLNTKTFSIGTSAKDLEIIIRNFEDHLIDEDTFATTLQLFDKSPDDFGYSVTVSEEDVKELEGFFSGEASNES